MKKRLHLFFLIGLCLMSLCIHAQENPSRQIYNQAESEYRVGRIDQAIQLLQDHMDTFDGAVKQSACRLLALCYLAEDKEKEARYYAGQLIKLNNYYNSTDDPARFQDLISQLKEGFTTTITTASSQSETINEAPVPITIITAEM
ncbi:MAG: TonB-dependent receptor, partial [Prevotella sp.]|nr:TonB-dependent receptor [Prevotella sp.]